jgi:two-component system chemotaxis response regulator CheB
MAHHDLVAIGASSGGVEVLIRIIAGLPEDFPAAVFVVLHVRPDAPSQLPAILNRSGRLPAAHAVDNEPVRRGRVYVAPPGMQTYVHHGRISVRRGPHENTYRPAIDPLFRTAAHYYGPRVVGVVLTGALDDGSAGLAMVKQAGGIAIVQDPREASFPDMPANALRATEPDFILKSTEIAPALVGLASNEFQAHLIPHEVALETVEEAADPAEAFRSDQIGRPSHFVCPDCSGTLYEIDDGRSVRFRCRVGHAYSEDSMLQSVDRSVERALWIALRSLEERSALMIKLADLARRRGYESLAQVYEQKSQQIELDVRMVHSLITAGEALEPVVHE